MTETGIASIIAAVGAAISALLSGVALVIGALNSKKIDQVHTATNGMSERLNRITGEAEHAKGYAEGVKQGEDNPRQRSE